MAGDLKERIPDSLALAASGKWTADIAIELSSCLAAPDIRISCGPHYLIPTSQGEELSIHAIGAHGPMPEKRTSCYFLFAYNSAGVMVGYRATDLDPVRRLCGVIGVLRGRGCIESLVKGEGISTSIELANLDLMQLEADDQQRVVVYEYRRDNSRKEHFDEVNKAQRKNPTLEGEQYLGQLKQEDQRWNSLYSTRGRLAPFTRRRVFLPNPTNHRPRDIGVTVRIQREDITYDGVPFLACRRSLVTPIADPEEYYAQMMDQVENIAALAPGVREIEEDIDIFTEIR
jgi:hypothetical protein